MVIKGGTWDCGTVVQPSSPASQNITVSVSSNTLRGLFMGSAAVNISNSIVANNAISVGASDGTNESVIGTIDEDAGANSDSYRINETTGNVIRSLSTNGVDVSVGAFTSLYK